ncbi:hypothetical protein AGMMS50230_21740 [Spirochaetia bacterium]|nr:hypothetical protein AGMMS50230_21740 [Spirochaetia bacterium]
MQSFLHYHFMMGTAAGFLIVTALAKLRFYGAMDREARAIPKGEFRCRNAAVASVLCTALGLAFPFIPGFPELSATLGLVLAFLGFLGFGLFLTLLLVLHHFPGWGLKYLPLPLLTVLTALLPFTGLKAPLVSGWFLLVLSLLCAVLFVYLLKNKQSWKPFLWGTLFFLVPGLSFVVPLGQNAFFWPAAFLAYLMLEHRFFPSIVPPAKTLLLSSPVTEKAEPEIAVIEEVEELTELEAGDETAPASPPLTVTIPAGVPPAELPVVVPSVSSFIPREFLAILNKKTVADLKLGDHIKQEMTIFFSDIRRFTDLSENLTPEESFAFINSYLSRIVPEITRNGGFVDKYIGDAILALFPKGAGADMAVRTAIAIQEKILEYNAHRAKCGYRPLSMGIGIHTGTLMVGVVGTKDRMQSTVISDAVNLASRVESLTKAFRISLAISEETFKKLEDPGLYQYRFIGKVRVKGKTEPVSIFEIFDGIDEKIQKKKVQANRFFEQGMFLYYQKKYTAALKEFRRVLEVLPSDGAAGFYIDNCMAKLKG